MKLTVPQLDNTFPAFYATRTFITAFTRARMFKRNTKTNAVLQLHSVVTSSARGFVFRKVCICSRWMSRSNMRETQFLLRGGRKLFSHVMYWHSVAFRFGEHLLGPRHRKETVTLHVDTNARTPTHAQHTHHTPTKHTNTHTTDTTHTHTHSTTSIPFIVRFSSPSRSTYCLETKVS